MPTEGADERRDAMDYARRVQAEAARLGFNWPSIDGVLLKIEEEVEEIREAIGDGDLVHARKELGDVMLAAVNAAHFLDADPEGVLQDAAERFVVRFDALRHALAEEQLSVEGCTLDELDAVWDRVKHHALEGLSKPLDKASEVDQNS